MNGWIEDSITVMQKSRVCLAPIQFGAGLKGKLVEAMQNGTPSVTTATGAEGINSDISWSGFIANTDRKFIQNAVQLYIDEKLWYEKQVKGFEIINRRFYKKEWIEKFRKRLVFLADNLEHERSHNFTGKMLKHHMNRSTYFMSKFIEEKNRNKN